MFIVPFPLSPESPSSPWRVDPNRDRWPVSPNPLRPFRPVPSEDIDGKIRRAVEDAFRRAEPPVVRQAPQATASTAANEPASFLSALINRLCELVSRCETSAERLGLFNDRVQGSAPENTHTAVAVTDASSTTQVLDEVVNRLATAQANLEEQLIRLNSLA